ncbi:MAG: DUF1996 domain-containing protein [Granulosicoccus sp.]
MHCLHFFRARYARFLSPLLILISLLIPVASFAAPGIVSPSASEPLSGTRQTFNWTADDVSVDSWWLYVGSAPGGSDIANSGNLGSNTQFELGGLPVDGSAVHVRLWYFSADRWGFVDVLYQAASIDEISQPRILSPAGGSVLTGGVQFQWSDNNTSVNYWWLYAGTAIGRRDLYNSGPALRTRTSITVDEFSADGSDIYVRLWFRTQADGWRFTDSVYSTSAKQPDIDVAIAQNLALINNNATRNTQFDDNPFRDVPASAIAVSDLTVNYDAYNEALLDTSNSGYFRVKCEVSHFAYDDPIVYPGEPGRAHLHMFFGNTQANAYSTYASLLNSGTGTCNGEDLNRTAYWVPALLDSEGNALIPDQVMVYYKNDNFRLNGANELVSPFPENLRMIAGDGAALSPQTGFTGDWEVQPAVSFTCGQAYNANDSRQALIPDCFGSGNHLEMQIAFPQCVNESAGTYQPDQSHMSYSENGYYGAACPESHPTDISSIMYRIFFSVDAYGGALTNLHLSSDVKMDRILPGGTTAHADWFGAWHPQAMDLWVDNCNNSQEDCETGILSRNPDISLVPRKRGFYPYDYKAPAEELIKLCPGKSFNPNEPLRSVAMCRMN